MWRHSGLCAERFVQIIQHVVEFEDGQMVQEGIDKSAVPLIFRIKNGIVCPVQETLRLFKWQLHG